MLRALQKLQFGISLSKNILVMDAGPLDVLINDFPQECLDRDVSAAIRKSYLSVCDLSENEIKKQTIYEGVIMGEYLRLFLSIPTRHLTGDKYYNVHYLLDTGSPITTLTRRALCAIHEKEYNNNSQLEFPLTTSYFIGSEGVAIQCSNPNKESESRPYHNVNILGMNFLRKFQLFNLCCNMSHRQFILELSKKFSLDWKRNKI